jgi:hypothetical protein
MNKFYLGMLIISFLYGCSTTPSTSQHSQDQSPTEVFKTISNPEPRVAPPCSTTEVGKATEEMLRMAGKLPHDYCL